MDAVELRVVVGFVDTYYVVCRDKKCGGRGCVREACVYRRTYCTAVTSVSVRKYLL